MPDMLNSRKRGDLAFREKDLRTVIDCYTQVHFFTILLIFLTGFTDGEGTTKGWSRVSLS